MNEVINQIYLKLNDETSKKKKLIELFEDIGFSDTINIIDPYDEFFFNEFDFGSEYDSEYWYWLKIFMKRLEPKWM